MSVILADKSRFPKYSDEDIERLEAKLQELEPI